ncbi:protein TBATA-like [Heptranchias perlo]|uniref:protein TBATA-like n=1 Tax=Heptranchias perlo TaxID=212740 RepID=UPI0035595520
MCEAVMMPPTIPQEVNPICKNTNEPLTTRSRLAQPPLPCLGYSTSRPATTNACRFGNLSQNTFFSRNIPHPRRVYHIQGLNDSLVCKVDDDCFSAQEQIKPPVIRQDLFRPKRPITANIPLTTPHPAHIISGIPQPPCKEGAQPDIGLLYSQAWREELRDLTARVEFFTQPTKETKEEENSKWSCQYPAERGQLTPTPTRPISRSSSRQSSRAGSTECARPVLTAAEREVLVLELLCQILQTDSLQMVQQWLLTTGQKEKEMALDLIRLALSNMNLSSPDSAASSTSKESYTSRQPAEDAEITIFRAPTASERRRARSQCQRLDSIFEKEPDRNRDLKMLESPRPMSSARQYSPQPKTVKKPKTLWPQASAKPFSAPPSPVTDGRLCHSKTDLYKT